MKTNLEHECPSFFLWRVKRTKHASCISSRENIFARALACSIRFTKTPRDYSCSIFQKFRSGGCLSCRDFQGRKFPGMSSCLGAFGKVLNDNFISPKTKENHFLIKRKLTRHFCIRETRIIFLFLLDVPDKGISADLALSQAIDLNYNRGTQRIVSVNYLFGRPLIPYNFLKGIFATNFRDMGNLRPSVFGLIKMLFRVPKKGQLRFSERK